MSDAPRFSIIVPHYQPSVSRADYVRCIHGIYAQTTCDYELLVYHDGPFTREDDWELDHVPKPRATKKRADCWGHNLLNLGIRKAKGEYLLFVNADNVLEPRCLENLDRVLRQPPMFPGDNPDIAIMPIRMMGVRIAWMADENGEYKHRHCRRKDFAQYGIYTILTGIPPAKYNIDRMSLCMRRELWLKEAGWKDKSAEADGNLYPKLCERYGYRSVPEVGGSHW